MNYTLCVQITLHMVCTFCMCSLQIARTVGGVSDRPAKARTGGPVWPSRMAPTYGREMIAAPTKCWAMLHAQTGKRGAAMLEDGRPAEAANQPSQPLDQGDRVRVPVPITYLRDAPLSVVRSDWVASSVSQAGGPMIKNEPAVVVELTACPTTRVAFQAHEDQVMLGDRTVFTHEIFLDEQPVGFDGGLVTVVRIAEGVPHLLCTVSISLPGGELSAQTFMEQRFPPPPFRSAITGGTRAFAGATGEVHIDPASPELHIYKLHLRGIDHSAVMAALRPARSESGAAGEGGTDSKASGSAGVSTATSA